LNSNSNVALLDDMLYDEQDLLLSYDKIEAVDYHQEVEFEGIKFTSYNAGHVLGAAMFLIEIAGVKACIIFNLQLISLAIKLINLLN
jgi:Cft2 family RNA processing exonuclease